METYTYHPEVNLQTARRELRTLVEEFNMEYCGILDMQCEAEKWPWFFTEDALYVVLSQENVDADLPAGIMYAEGRNMMRDRIVATTKTQMFAPHRTLHMVANTMIGELRSDTEFASRSNVVVFRTLLEEKTKLHLAGYYDDVFVHAGGKLLLKCRRVIYQTMEIDRDLVFPV